MDEATESRALRSLVGILESGRPLAYIRSAEEQRVRALLRETVTDPVGPEFMAPAA